MTALDEHTLCVSASLTSGGRSGYCALIDRSAGTLISQIRDVYAIDRNQSAFYTKRGSELIRYPVYTTEELIRRAEKEIS